MKFTRKMVLLPQDRYERLTRKGLTSENDALPDDNIIAMLSERLRTKGRSLLYFIRHRTDLEWNERGQLLRDGVPIPFSNISDLIKDALVSHKTFVPAGMHYFYQRLKDVPLTLIYNNDRRRLIQHSEDGPPSSGAAIAAPEGGSHPWIRSWKSLS